MTYKLINASALRQGSIIIIEGEPCVVKNIDFSKTGKHGHAKVRIGAVGIFDNRKRVLVKPGQDKFEVPLINKKRAQVLSVSEKKASIMDMTSYETLEVPFIENLKSDIEDGKEVEYWDIENEGKIIKRVY